MVLQSRVVSIVLHKVFVRICCEYSFHTTYADMGKYLITCAAEVERRILKLYKNIFANSNNLVQINLPKTALTFRGQFAATRWQKCREKPMRNRKILT